MALWAIAVTGGLISPCFFLRHVTFPFSAISFALVAPWAMSCDFKHCMADWVISWQNMALAGLVLAIFNLLAVAAVGGIH